MGYFDFAAAVAIGNIMTIAIVWGAVQFHRHDYQAPWLAYAAFIFPIILIVANVVVTEGLTPHFDAIATH